MRKPSRLSGFLLLLDRITRAGWASSLIYLVWQSAPMGTKRFELKPTKKGALPNRGRTAAATGERGGRGIRPRHGGVPKDDGRARHFGPGDERPANPAVLQHR